MALTHVKASSSFHFLRVTHPIRLHCPPDPVIPFIVLPRLGHGRWEEITQTAPQTSQDTLSVGTPSSPSAYSRTPLQKPREQKEAPAAQETRISEYYDTSASHPLMSLGVIMLTWTWNKTTKLIYPEVDLLHSRTAWEFTALWHSLALNHMVQVQWRRQMKPLMRGHLYCTLIASSLLWNLYYTFSNMKPSH